MKYNYANGYVHVHTAETRNGVISYLMESFHQEFPNRPVETFHKNLAAVSTDDLLRLANAVDRFGLTTIINAIND